MPAPIIAAGAAAGARVVGSGAARSAAKSVATSGARATQSAASQGVKPISRPSGKPNSPKTAVSESTNIAQEESASRAQKFRQNINDASDIIDSAEDEGGDNEVSTYINYRIGFGVAMLLSMFAGFLDVIEFILDLVGTKLLIVGVLIGYLKDFFAIIVIPIIFLLLKAPFWKGRKAKKKLVTMMSSFLISLVPWLGALMPETLLGVIATIYLTRKEDEESAGQKVEDASSTITRYKRVVSKIRK